MLLPDYLRDEPEEQNGAEYIDAELQACCVRGENEGAYRDLYI